MASGSESNSSMACSRSSALPSRRYASVTSRRVVISSLDFSQVGHLLFIEQILGLIMHLLHHPNEHIGPVVEGSRELPVHQCSRERPTLRLHEFFHSGDVECSGLSRETLDLH